MLIKKQIICIECPKACLIAVDIKESQIIRITGNNCDQGKIYAKSEVENPLRILTSSVLGVELERKMIPVKTDKSIPKSLIFDIMELIKKIKIRETVKQGQIISPNILGLGVNIIATATVFKLKNKGVSE
ncbi:MAG: DUF1667 domain-containing protein [Candidatus Omnitrophota bacterium]